MININLIAERRARKIRELAILSRSVMGVILLLAAMLAINGLTWSSWYLQKADLRQVNLKLKNAELKAQALNEIKQKIAEKRPMVTLLEHVQVSEGAWITMLADFSRVTPPNIALTSFSTQASDKDMVLQVAGRASDEDAVGDYMMALRQHTKWAASAKLGSVTADPQNGVQAVRFDLKISVRGLLGGEL